MTLSQGPNGECYSGTKHMSNTLLQTAFFHKNILWAEERWIHIANKLKSFRVF